MLVSSVSTTWLVPSAHASSEAGGDRRGRRDRHGDRRQARQVLGEPREPCAPRSAAMSPAPFAPVERQVVARGRQRRGDRADVPRRVRRSRRWCRAPARRAAGVVNADVSGEVGPRHLTAATPEAARQLLVSTVSVTTSASSAAQASNDVVVERSRRAGSSP